MSKKIILTFIGSAAVVMLIGFLTLGWFVSSTTKTLFVYHRTIPCEGVAPQECLLVRDSETSPWRLQYDHIKGFDFVEGTTYEIKVIEQNVEAPPADASSISYKLDRVVNEVQAGTGPFLVITNPIPNEALSDPNIQVTGYGGGLFEGNVVVTIGNPAASEVLVQEATTMSSQQIGGKGFWTIDLPVSISGKQSIEVSASSPSPADNQQGPISETVPFTLAAASAENPSQIEGISWKLISYQNSATLTPANSATSTLTMKDGQANGNGGCNSFFGPYTINGSNISFGNLGSTLVACPFSVGVQEGNYLKALGNTSSFQSSGSTLTFYNNSGQPTAVFEKQDTSIEGKDLKATGVNNQKEQAGVQSIVIGTQITARFEDGKVSGIAGCNNYNAQYTIENNTIEIGPAASTRKLCSQPEGTMEQEANYLSALSKAKVIEISANQITLRDENGSTQIKYTQ